VFRCVDRLVGAVDSASSGLGGGGGAESRCGFGGRVRGMSAALSLRSSLGAGVLDGSEGFFLVRILAREGERPVRKRPLLLHGRHGGSLSKQGEALAAWSTSLLGYCAKAKGPQGVAGAAAVKR
jgi:hypothetical protein